MASCWWSGCFSCRSERSVYICIGICRGSSATFPGVVFNYDTGCSFQSRTPPCIYVELLGDPETANVAVGLRILKEAIVIICICHVDSLIVVCRNSIFINSIGFTVEYLCARFIKIPANEIISGKVSSRRLTDMSAFTDTEVHGLTGSSPVDVTCCAVRIIHMQEYTVLFLAPLRIHCDTAFRHLVECVWMSAGTVKIPAFKNKS